MIAAHLLRHVADVYRAHLAQGTAQTIDGYGLVYRQVRCFVQPMSSSESQFYLNRGLEDLHTIYTGADRPIQRNDVLAVNGRDYHVVGVKDGLLSGYYLELACSQYPEGAARRPDRGAYG